MTKITSRPFHTLSFAVVSGLSDAPALLHRICEELGHGTSRILIPQVLRTYAELTQQMMRGTIHLAWMPPLIAVQLQKAQKASVVLCSVRGGRSTYHSVLFVQKSSETRILSDLAGKHVAWVERQSASGYVLPRLKLASSGVEPDTLFGRQSFHENHVQVAREVFEGRADVGATFAVFDPRTGRLSHAGWVEAGYPLESAHLLSTAGPIPSDSIVVSSRVAPEIVSEVSSAISQLPRRLPRELRALLAVDDFVPPQASHFDDLAQLLQTSTGRAASL